MKQRFVPFLPAIAWFIIINILLLLPGKDLPKDPFLEEIYFDKWVHISIFGMLTFLAAYPLIKLKKLSPKILLNITIASILYGILMEYAQKYLTADRAFDIYDMIADAAGCSLAYFFLKWLMTKNYTAKQSGVQATTKR